MVRRFGKQVLVIIVEEHQIQREQGDQTNAH